MKENFLETAIDEEQGLNNNEHQDESNQDESNQDDDQNNDQDDSNQDDGNQNDNNQSNDEKDDDLLNEAEKEYETALNLIYEGDEELAKEFLDKYKGKEFDNDGNIVDENGEIVKSKEDIVKDLSKEEDVTYDNDGNVIDEKGNIVKTKEEVASEKVVANQIAKKLGYEFQDETGNLKVYKEGEEGIQEFANDLATYQTEQKLKEHYESNPVLAEVSKHILAGGNLEDFKKPIDYSKIETKGLTKEQKQNYIKKSFIEEGVSEERAQKLAENAKDLDKDTEEALQVLAEKDEKRKEERNQKLQQAQQQKQQQIEEYWENVENTINKGKLKDIEIPSNDRNKFFEYLAVPTKEGKTKYSIDKEKQTLEDTLQEAYYRFKGYSLKDIVNDNVNKSRAKSLRQRIKEAEQNKSSNNSNVKGQRSKPIDISLDNIVE